MTRKEVLTNMYHDQRVDLVRMMEMVNLSDKSEMKRLHQEIEEMGNIVNKLRWYLYKEDMKND